MGRSPGAYYLETCMMLRTGSTPDLQEPHSHDFDEYLVFLGTDPDDHFDLGGEVELWVGDEKRLLTRSCAVFVPAGVPHCPLVSTGSTGRSCSSPPGTAPTTPANWARARDSTG